METLVENFEILYISVGVFFFGLSENGIVVPLVSSRLAVFAREMYMIKTVDSLI